MYLNYGSIKGGVHFIHVFEGTYAGNGLVKDIKSFVKIGYPGASFPDKGEPAFVGRQETLRRKDALRKVIKILLEEQIRKDLIVFN